MFLEPKTLGAKLVLFCFEWLPVKVRDVNHLSHSVMVYLEGMTYYGTTWWTHFTHHCLQWFLFHMTAFIHYYVCSRRNYRVPTKHTTLYFVNFHPVHSENTPGTRFGSGFLLIDLCITTYGRVSQSYQNVICLTFPQFVGNQPTGKMGQRKIFQRHTFWSI